jgi:hypothetical protein
MTETIWLMAIIWIVLLILMWKVKNAFIPAIGGVVGILFGLEIMSSVNSMLGFVIIFAGFYQLYLATFKSK